jgi:hypothetical protein
MCTHIYSEELKEKEDNTLIMASYEKTICGSLLSSAKSQSSFLSKNILLLNNERTRNIYSDTVSV